jgi:hypothetical protein
MNWNREEHLVDILALNNGTKGVVDLAESHLLQLLSVDAGDVSVANRIFGHQNIPSSLSALTSSS